MGRTEAEKRAQARYEKKRNKSGITKGFYLKCHTVHDADVIERLGSVENTNGYIKELIRADIKKDGE